MLLYLLIVATALRVPAALGQSQDCSPTNSSADTRMLTADNKTCFFPFVFNGQVYDDCVGDIKKWCPTTCNFQADLQFSWCQWERKNLLRPTCKNLTTSRSYSEPETATGAKCVFPFVFQNECYESCNDSGTTYNWCGNSPSVDLNPDSFSRCLYQRNTPDKPECAHAGEAQKYKYPDTETGQRCVFPYYYGEDCYSECLGPRGGDYWCSTGKTYVDPNWVYCKFLGNIKMYETFLKHGLYAIYAECSHSSFCGGAVVSSRSVVNESVVLVKDASAYAIRVWEVIPQPDSSIIVRVPLQVSLPSTNILAWTFFNDNRLVLGTLGRYRANVRFVLNSGTNKPNVFSLSQIVDTTATDSSIVGFRGAKNDERITAPLEEVPLTLTWRFELLQALTREDLKDTNSTFTRSTTPGTSRTAITATADPRRTDVPSPGSTIPPVIPPTACYPNASAADPGMTTTDNNTCYFPFTYKNVTYEDCAGNTKKWCATSCNLNRDLQFSWCRWERKNLQNDSCKNLPNSRSYAEPETRTGIRCVFPFVYKNQCYENCTNIDTTYIWCANTHSADLNPTAFSPCQYQRQTTGKPECANLTDAQKYRYPDTETGERCVFPFMHGEDCKSDCIDIGEKDYWCSASKVYGVGNWTFCKFFGNIKAHETFLKHGLYLIYADCSHSSFCGGSVVSSRSANNEPILLVSDNSSYAIKMWEVIPQPGSSVIIRVPLLQTSLSKDQLAWTFSANGSVTLKTLGKYRENIRFVLKNVTNKVNVLGLSKVIDVTTSPSSMVGFRGIKVDPRSFAPLEEVPISLLWKFILVKEFTQDDLKDFGVDVPVLTTAGAQQTTFTHSQSSSAATSSYRSSYPSSGFATFQTSGSGAPVSVLPGSEHSTAALPGSTSASSSSGFTHPRSSFPGSVTPGSAISTYTPPGITFPSSGLPGSSVPGSAIPGSILPGSSYPGPSLPGSALTGSTLPGSTLPGSSYPGHSLPGSTIHGSAIPGSSVPGSSLPGTTQPGSANPRSPVPGSSFPGSTLPESAIPGSSVLGTTFPGSSLPATTLLGSAIPGSSLPATTLLGSAIPGSSISGSVQPASSLPGSTIPRSALPGTTATLPGPMTTNTNPKGSSDQSGSVATKSNVRETSQKLSSTSKNQIGSVTQQAYALHIILGAWACLLRRWIE